MLYVTEDCKYKSVEELVARSAIVLKRVFQDKVWSLLNQCLVERCKMPDTSGWEPILYAGDPQTPAAINYVNPFTFPNDYIEEIFGECIDYTNLQTPIFKMSKIFLQALSVRRNYQQVVNDLINNLVNDGLTNPYHYSAAIVYFLTMCMEWNWYMNRTNPSSFSERDLFYDNLLILYCQEITQMAVNHELKRINDFNQNCDMDTLLYDVIGILDNTIVDTIWCAEIGHDVCPLEGGLSEEYEYFEDSNDFRPHAVMPY